MSNEIPRRIQVDKFTPAEKAINDAQVAVEAMPADVRLTNAGIKLAEARALVADFVDGVPARTLETACAVCLVAGQGREPVCPGCLQHAGDALKAGPTGGPAKETP